MKYYFIVGEASGDLHASNLMRALKEKDAQAEFRFLGGDLMQAVGGTLVKHYKEMAFMGFVTVLLHLPTILRNLSACKADILSWQPDVVILVDYPGFNLKIAAFTKKYGIPTYYYISPKIWAWKEGRIKQIKKNIDELFSILPFEVDFYRKHQYPIHYVGNPCVDAIKAFKAQYKEEKTAFYQKNNLTLDKPIIALLAGSRKKEIEDNLPKMLYATKEFRHYQAVIAAAPGIDPSYYAPYIKEGVSIVYDQTYALLSHSSVALVTSGTATLETALLDVPQIVCYATPIPPVISWLKKHFLKVEYISLVNLILNKELIPELVAKDYTIKNLTQELQGILGGGEKRKKQLSGYQELKSCLGEDSASEKAATAIIHCLGKE